MRAMKSGRVHICTYGIILWGVNLTIAFYHRPPSGASCTGSSKLATLRHHSGCHLIRTPEFLHSPRLSIIMSEQRPLYIAQLCEEWENPEWFHWQQYILIQTMSLSIAFFTIWI